MGDVLGDLNARRAQIEDVGFRGQQRVIMAKVPLRRMFGYSTDLRIGDPGPRDVLDAVRDVRRVGVGRAGERR